jgi:GT2 family glycosyltransferase
MTAFWKQIGFHRLFPKSKIFGRYNLTYLDENEINQVDAISGSFMFIRREAFEEVGYLDEDYFMYCEDVDYCYRVTGAGWKVYYAPVSDIIHYKGESTKKNNLDYVLNFNKSLYLFYKKHFHKKYFSFFAWFILFGIFFRGIFIYSKNFLITHFSYILDLLLVNSVIIAAFIIRFELKSSFSFDEFFNQYIVINILATAIFSGVAFSLDLYRKYKFLSWPHLHFF